MFVLLVYCVARWLWPIEFIRLPWFDAPPGHAADLGVGGRLGTFLLGSGLLAIAGAGFSGFPTARRTRPTASRSRPRVALLAVLAGIALLRQPLPSRERVP